MQNPALQSMPSPLSPARPEKLRVAIGLILTLAGGQASAIGFDCLNDNQQATLGALSNVLEQLYPGFTSEPPPGFPTNFDPNATNNTTCDPTLFQSITPDQVFAMGSQATRINGGKISQPSNYFNLKRGQASGGGSGDADFSPLGFWGKVDSDFGSRDTTFSQSGFEFDNHNFVFGADYRLKDNWVVGSSFAYRHNNATFDNGRGKTLHDSYTGSLYTAYNITDALHVEATANYGGFSYETTRSINLGGLGTSVAKGSPDGGQYAFSWGGGYDFNYKALLVAPYMRGEYSNLDIDGYSETGSDFAVRFGKQSIESLTSTLGVQTAYTFSLPWGVLIPQLRGEWHHQYRDGQRLLQASFVADPSGQNFTLSSDGPSRDYFTFGAEVSSVLPGGISAFLAYETLQGYTSVNSNKLMLGARLEF